MARASAAVDRAAAINPLFNSFIPFGRAPIVDSDSEEYAGIPYLLDVVLPSIAGECGGQDAICFNGGLAPHNLEGTHPLFGDLYTKGNRPERARRSYLTAAVAGESRGWRPEFVARARALAAAAYDRAALYQDEDPGNDPPFTDLGGAGNCAYCHSF